MASERGICSKTYLTKAAKATISTDVVPAGSQNKSTRRSSLCRRLAAKNKPKTMIATSQNQGDKTLAAIAANPIAFSPLIPEKVTKGREQIT